MNIREDSAGSISEKDILDAGFTVQKRNDYSDMGQMTYTLTDYVNDKGWELMGGYWHWSILDAESKLLFEGWWNTKEEFQDTLRTLNNETP